MFEPILLNKNSELPELMDFLNSHLRPEENWSIDSEYPLTFSTKNLSNICIIRSNNEIVSHAACKYLLIQTTYGLFKVAAIGSVVTHPKFRNKGFAEKLINNLTAHAYNQGCDFAVLWTDLYSFYQKLNFELAGYEVSFKINKALDVDNQGLKFLCNNKIDPNAISKLYKKHTLSSARSIDSIRKCLNIPNSQVFTAWDKSNQLKAYAIEGRGKDLHSYIHEWGGDLQYLLPLLSEAHKNQNKTLTLISSRHSQKLNSSLEQLGLSKSEGFLGMFKMLDTKNLFFKIHRRARQLGIEDFVLEKKNEYFYLGVGENIFRTKSQRDFTKIIFGPADMNYVQGIDEKTKAQLEKLLPMPMWIWGWDSI